MGIRPQQSPNPFRKPYAFDSPRLVTARIQVHLLNEDGETTSQTHLNQGTMICRSGVNLPDSLKDQDLIPFRITTKSFGNDGPELKSIVLLTKRQAETGIHPSL